MIKKTFLSMKKINYKMLFSLMVLALVPAIYTTVRIFFLGQLPSDWSYSIAGQLSWVSLIYEVISEAIILPLFFFIGKAINDKSELSNRIKTGLIATFVIYTFLSLFVFIFAKELLVFMKADNAILEDATEYIRIESIAKIFSTMLSYVLVVLVTINKEKYIYIVTGLKLILCIMFDTFFVSSLNFSLNLGVNGIGYSNIVVSIILLVLSILILKKEDIYVFTKEKLSFKWMKDFIKIGGISGIESLVRNLAYMLMISRMINVVNEQGTYWVANNFIWGWLLLPIIQLGELIKRDIGSEKDAIKEKTRGYFAITFAVILLWLVLIPTWKPFMTYVLQYSDVDKLFYLVIILVGFYALYAIQNVFDATFYGLGKTKYMLFESIVTNSIYYGTAFILYKTGVWIPSLTSIALLFGIGMAFDSIVSFGAYLYLIKKRNIKPSDVNEYTQTNVDLNVNEN